MKLRNTELSFNLANTSDNSNYLCLNIIDNMDSRGNLAFRIYKQDLILNPEHQVSYQKPQTELQTIL